MSQEERSELSTELFSDLSSEETEAAEVNTEDSDNYVWDNYREDPSFVEKDPEKEDLIVERKLRSELSTEPFQQLEEGHLRLTISS